MKNINIKYLVILTIFTVLYGILPLYGQDGSSGGRGPIDINLIIDSSSAYTGVRDEISAWIASRLDQILADGDRVTVWSAGATARVVYSGVMSGSAERDAVKKTIRELSASGNTSDFTGALRDASGRQSGAFSYTLLICASPHSISNASHLRYSRVEEFKNWRALVVGLNLDSKVKKATDSFFGSI